MTGAYMNAPADRIPWDRDGSVLVMRTTTAVTFVQSATKRALMNSETSAPATGGQSGFESPGSNEFGQAFAVLFPMPMDLAAFFWANYYTLNNFQGWRVETSKDTTNGIDGTWTVQIEPATPGNVVKPNYRIASRLSYLQPGTASQNLRGIRFTARNLGFTAQESITNLHLYGTPSALATKDRLRFDYPSTDAKLPPQYFDWGDVPRGSTQDRSFRLKNLSLELIANSVEVYSEALTPGTPEVDNFLTFSIDNGVSFLPSVTIDSIEPGGYSPVIIVRRIVPVNAQISTWTTRISADVEDFTEETP